MAEFSCCGCERSDLLNECEKIVGLIRASGKLGIAFNDFLGKVMSTDPQHRLKGFVGSQVPLHPMP